MNRPLLLQNILSAAQFEALHRPLQLCRHFFQLLARGSDLMNGSRLLLRRGGNCLRLFGKCGGNRLDRVNGFRDALAAAIRFLDRLSRTLDAREKLLQLRDDLLEGTARFVDGLHAAQRHFCAGLHGDDRILRALLDVVDDARDVLRRVARLLRELSHLFGDDSESLAVLTRACRLDRRVECEKVRLLGNARNRIDDLADLCLLYTSDAADEL